MDPNQNIPSEREWTMEEMEEFFSKKYTDAYLSNSTPSLPDAEPVTVASLLDALAEYDAKFSRPDQIIPRVHITHIVPPAQGWPIAVYCPICKETTFALSPWAIKPADGDYWKMNDVCGNPDLANRHNIQMAINGYWKFPEKT